MIGAVIAIVVIILAAVVAVRSAREETEPAVRAPVDRSALEPIHDEPPADATAPEDAAAAHAPDTAGAIDARAFDPEATQSMDVASALDSGNGARVVFAPAPPPVGAPPAPSGTGVASSRPAVATPQRPLVFGSPVVIEDLGLDEVLAVAEEPSAPARHPGWRLAGGIAVLGLIFAGALLIVMRSIGSLFGNFLK